MGNVSILGLKVDKVTFKEALGDIESFLNDRVKHLVVTPYAESVVNAQRDSEFLRIINSASLSVPDGGGLLAAGEYLSYQLPKNRWLKVPVAIFYGFLVGFKLAFYRKSFSQIHERVSGTDLVASLCEISSRTGKKVYFLGGGGSEAWDAATILKLQYPNLQILADSGPASLKSTSVEEMDLVIKKINSFSPDFLFVAFSPGEQEKWLSCHMSEINAKVFMAVGGAFNMISGHKRRAPGVFRKLSLEWLWRLLIEPQRIARIYKAVITFPWLVFKYKLSST
jgi:N-acetylglucosaminyldiphosphoundecaprenol N-acetyl-beta-D-mannosaminyltransferase